MVRKRKMRRCNSPARKGSKVSSVRLRLIFFSNCWSRIKEYARAKERKKSVYVRVCMCVRGKIINTNRDIPRRSARRKKNYLRPWYSLRMTLSKHISSTVKEHFFEFLYFFIFYCYYYYYFFFLLNSF